MQEIEARIRLRRDSQTNWETANPVLASGEPGIIISGVNIGRLKVGDGVTPWNNLPYVIGANGLAATIAIGSVTTGAPSSPASVVNSGTSTDAVFDFSIPQGNPGTTVPDITGLTEQSAVKNNDLLFNYDSTAAALKKISAETLFKFMMDKQYPVGEVYEQIPGAPSPEDKFPWQTWVPWNDRASMYRLRQAPLPAYTTYTAGVNYVVNAVVMWHLDGDDYGFYQANRAITNAAAQLDPVMWNQLKTGSVIERKSILNINPWTDPDLVIGQQITGGDYNGYWIEEVIVYGGKFFSVTGGNRPTFITGGVQQGRIVNATGYFGGQHLIPAAGLSAADGLFRRKENLPFWHQGSGSGGSNSLGFDFDLSRGLLTGPDVAPADLSIRIWRRVS
jgi:hypothetical protein